MVTADAIAQFRRAHAWLGRQPRTKNVNRSAGISYGLKHEIEAEGAYVSNGIFIAAAIACGFRVDQSGFNSLNAWLNISQLRLTNPNLQVMVPHPMAVKLLRELSQDRLRPGSAPRG
jgi:hypothetical protein